jgi:hypothetical protein
MEFISFKCDECGKVRGESNHWFWLLNLPGRCVIGEWGAPIRDENAKPQHLCGIGCAVKAMSKAMGEA